MCTVSLIALDDADVSGGAPSAPAISRRGLRLACNRDESRNRPEARPPEIRQCGDFRTIMPIDPVSDGTWIAVNEAGVIATLLNTYQRPAAERPARDKSEFRSRGTIVPAMMTRDDARAAVKLIERLDPGSFPPFMVIAVDGKSFVELISDGQEFRRADSSWGGRPRLYSTSGLGDEIVYPPRRALFDETFSKAGDFSSAQDRFHRHQWPDRPHVSVCMNRAEARTVSTTIVEVSQGEVSLAYQPVPPSGASPEVRVSMPLTQRV